MTTANALTPKEVAALMVIGDKILSGRTKDKNIGYIAEYLTALGIDLREVRVVGDGRPRSSMRSMRSDIATLMSSRLAVSDRPMTTSPPTVSRRRSGCRSTSIRARSPSCTTG
jgi:Probable molybdopterin binding domain